MAARRKSNGPSRKEMPDGAQLLLLELQEIHNAESQLSRLIPRLAKAVEAQTLQQMLETRLSEGERIIGDIEAVLDEMEESPGRKKNVAAEGLIADAREHVQEIAPGPALDCVLIGAIQKTEHYCIAAWGTARALAQALGEETAAKAMERALEEGKRFDEELTELAEREVTPALLAQASDEAEDEEEEEEAGDDDEEAQSGRKRSRKGSKSERRISG